MFSWNGTSKNRGTGAATDHPEGRPCLRCPKQMELTDDHKGPGDIFEPLGKSGHEASESSDFPAGESHRFYFRLSVKVHATCICEIALNNMVLTMSGELNS